MELIWYLVDGAESSVAENAAASQFGLFDDPQLGQIGFDLAGTQRLAVLVAAHDHRHLGRVLLRYGALVPVVAETGEEDAQQADAADDAAHDGRHAVVLAVDQRLQLRLARAVRVAAVVGEDAVRHLRRTAGRTVEGRLVVRHAVLQQKEIH